MKTHLHGLVDYGWKLKLSFGVGDLDLPERRRSTSRVGRKKTGLQIGTWKINKKHWSLNSPVNTNKITNEKQFNAGPGKLCVWINLDLDEGFV